MSGETDPQKLAQAEQAAEQAAEATAEAVQEQGGTEQEAQKAAQKAAEQEIQRVAPELTDAQIKRIAQESGKAAAQETMREMREQGIIVEEQIDSKPAPVPAPAGQAENAPAAVEGQPPQPPAQGLSNQEREIQEQVPRKPNLAQRFVKAKL